MLWLVASVRRGRPRTAALRLKSYRVLGMVLLFDEIVGNFFEDLDYSDEF